MKSKLSIFFIILITLVSIMNISFAETGRLVDIPVPPNSSGYADFTEKEAADRAREYEESKNNAVTADYFVGKSSDNYLKSLNVEGYELSPEFNRQMDTYTIYVKDDSINTFNVTAEPDNENAKTVLFQIIAGELEPDEGSLIWGTTITQSYFPKDNNYLFDVDLNITDWLRQYSKDPDETYVRSFLGRMLFSGEEALKKVAVLSGGEKVRCVLSKIMLSGANFLIMDEPTNHLDMESITALNEGMTRFKGNMLFTSHDHQLMQTVANRIIDIKQDKTIDREVTYNEYLGIE